MNNPNPFLPQSSFLEQKNKARARLKIAVFFSISLSVMALMALLIQGCRKPNDTADNSGTDTNATPSLPTNPPDLGSNVAVTPPPDTNPPPPLPVPPAPIPAPVPPAPTAEDYTVIKGDTFATIAKKSGVSTKAIVDANPGVDPKKLKIGEKLHVPSGGTAPTPSAVASIPGVTDSTASGGEQTYKVKSGDTLTSIAKHFHVTIKAIESANNLTTASIRVGKVLKIPGSAASAPVPAPVETMPPPAPVTTTAPAPASPMPAH
ncbi:MAG TPA: LysM peptidoglycan-binding domain-containing protein [Verrucomicrobiae bacterium]|jgi:LysM repeat protein|nr:LysM peptidoglycan-binding domain-containing protein [Verrucomicrobiae bacterium]